MSTSETRSLFLRMALPIGVGAVAVVLAGGLWFDAQYRSVLSRQDASAALHIAESAAMMVNTALADENYDGIADSLRAVMQGTRCMDVLALDAEGGVVVAMSRAREDAAVVERPALAHWALPKGAGVRSLASGRLEAWAPVGQLGQAGWVRVQMWPVSAGVEVAALRGRLVALCLLTCMAMLAVMLFLMTRTYLRVDRREAELLLIQRGLRDEVHRDRLTGLLNRVGLMERLELALASRRAADRMLAVCYLDLDGFKAVNDRFGHAVGDLMLVEVSRRLLGCVREGDTVARLGGDEFVLLLEGDTRQGELLGLLERVVQRVSQQVPGGKKPLRVGVSIGVTLGQSSADTAASLLEQADEAMYEAKRGGRNRWVLHPSVSGSLFMPGDLQPAPS